MNKLFPLLFLFVISCGSKEEPEKKEETPPKEETVDDVSNVASDETETLKNEATNESMDCSGSVGAYLNDPDLSGTNIRNAPNGKVVFKLVKSDDNFEYFITATAAKEGWFKIEPKVGGMESDITIESEECWIHGSVLGASTRNYGGQTISIFMDKEKSKEIFQIKQETAFSLIDLCGNMVKIKWNDEKGNHEGWMDIDWVCGNPLTNCS